MASRDSERLRPGDLPFKVGVVRGAWQSVVRAAQGNFDHLMGVIRDLVRAHNSLVDDITDLKDYVVEGLTDTAPADHTHDGSDPDGGGAISVDHGNLTGLGDDDHPQYMTPAEHTAVGDSSPHHAALIVQEEDVTKVSPAQTLDFDGSDFNVADEGSGEARVSLAYGTVAGTPAEGDHTHAGGSGTITVEADDGDPSVANVDTVQFEEDHFVVTDETGGVAKVALEAVIADHPGDTADAHAASAISIADAGNDFDATDVEGALAELQSDLEGVQSGDGALINHVLSGTLYWVYEDFGGNISGISKHPFTSNSGLSGVGATPAVSEAEHPGIHTTSTGTANANGNARILLGFDGGEMIWLGTGRTRMGWWVKTPSALSDGTHRYWIHMNLCDAEALSGGGASGTSAIEVYYKDDVNSGKWAAICRDSSSNSAEKDLGVIVAADTWYFLEFEVNAAGTSVEFFIDHVSKGTISTDIPTGVGLMGIWGIRKTVGTGSARTIKNDAVYLLQDISR